MIRLLANIIYIFLLIKYKDASTFMWTIWEKAKLLPKGYKKNIYWCILRKICKEYGASIPIEADIKECPCFPHGISGIFISEGATIGGGCVLFQQVTIGSNTLKDSKNYGAPTIGNNVYIGAGAKIIGNVKIGNHCRIGANCVVTTDMEDNVTVVMPHPIIYHYDNVRDNTYINYVGK